MPHTARHAAARLPVLGACLRAVALTTGMALGAGLAAGAARAEETVERQDRALWLQSTYNWQRHGSFRSPYATAYSLSSQREHMYTFSATVMGGVRVWDGGELYGNAEVVQGVPFSDALVGLGSFTNGEITRAAGSNPMAYRQRLFLRQTWNHGGGRENQASEQNQLAGVVDRNRFVLTVGNFSTLDVVDDNSYAKDPRTQFMNWSHWTYGAYDYAADARGFGWGAMGEWYRGDWVLRFGRMSGPTRPNELPTDLALGKHYGDQVEIDHAHSLGGQPGHVRVLAWRNRAVMARFDDARQWLLAHPGSDPQAFFAVRSGERIKYGLGLNLEQAVSDDLGGFLRVMKADGRTETLAFTEIDQSLSLGLLLKGTRWGRGGDTVGLAYASNGLSAARRGYLAAGGLSYFIGDGALRYGPENALEAFYSLSVGGGASVTVDWQRIDNPAYNRDRGPVNVLALRLHIER